MFKSSVHRYVKLQNFSLCLEISRLISWPLLVNFHGEVTWDLKGVILKKIIKYGPVPDLVLIDHVLLWTFSVTSL